MFAGDADAVLQLRQAVVAELQAHPEVCLNIGCKGHGGGAIVIVLSGVNCRYIAVTAEQLARAFEIDDDDDDGDDDDDDDDDDEGGAGHVLGSSFAAAEDFEHLLDVDEDEDEIDENDEEVCYMCVCNCHNIQTVICALYSFSYLCARMCVQMHA
jgi:hypothetical protein